MTFGSTIALILGVALLALFLTARRGKDGGPAWWYPPTRPDTPKIMLTAGPLFAMLIIVASFRPVIRSHEGLAGPWGLVAAILLVLLLISSFTKVPRWVKPAWLRAAETTNPPTPRSGARG